ncbi:MAG TPA: hypothetical protein VKN64_04485 [Halanaerobiales bacterium]|nr:hypothetical protein [Halanaerobiales bacterium]
MNNNKLTKGDEIELVFIKNEKGKRPISRLDNGKICILDRDTKGFFPVGSKWVCQIIKVEDKKVIFAPLYMIATPRETALEIAEKSKSLAAKFSK